MTQKFVNFPAKA